MKQVIPQIFSNQQTKHKTANKKALKKNSVISHPKYGTSQLEKDFAKEFLDKYNIVYIYQYELKEIGRYMDFAVTCYRDKTYLTEEKDGIKCVMQEGQFFNVSFFIEIDGDYWHVNPNKFKDVKLTPTQKHNIFVDKQKNQYAALRGIPLVRIWENDIRNNPKKVLTELQKYINIGNKRKIIEENKQQPH